MEKISIAVRIPALNNSYDFIVPDNMTVQDVQKLIIRILSSEYGVSNNNMGLQLFDMTDGKALRMECTFMQQGISDGAKLLLI